ncbi:gem-associated protein 7-like [Rhodnius prolixus]|uniref:Gemin 7 n=1 Tax=Rhodnius prolixus TaxID=13249 RepID=T1ID94_RHOPR
METAKSCQESPDLSCYTEEKQDARAFLRERFLRCISGFVGTPCELTTLENSQLKAEYNGMDIDGQDIFLKNLVTPMCNLKFALVRTTDVINMHLPCVKINLSESEELNEN